MLDSTAVALALSSIKHDIGATSTGLRWVMNAYLLVISVLVVTAGRLGDMFGRKAVFLAGTVAFAAGSVLSGAAQDEVMLVAGRVVQGVGAAAMLPLSLAIVCDAFPRSEQPRRRWGSGPGSPPWRWRSGRCSAGNSGLARLAGDLLAQPAGGGARVPDHGEGGARIHRSRRRSPDRLPRTGGAERRDDRRRPRDRRVAELGLGLAGHPRSCSARASSAWPHSGRSSTASRTRSSTSPCSATARTSAPARPPSPWSAPTGR